MNINMLQPERNNIPRQSNMEALRIIAMSMILIHHFMIHGLTPENIPNNLYQGLNSFVYCGVTIFFLISGFFTIRYSFSGLLKLILTILFFDFINLILLGLVGATPQPRSWIFALMFPVTQSPYWFIKVYLFLYMTAPILNAGLRNISQRVLRNTLIILLFTLFYSRTYLGIDGYLHGMYLYCAGYYIGKYQPWLNVPNQWWLVAFFLFTGLSNCAAWTFAYFGHPVEYFTSYHNVLIFLGGATLLLYFRKLDFRSNAVNSIATASLGCYLLQDGLFGLEWLYDFQSGMFARYGYSTGLFLIFAGFFAAFWVSSWLLTRFMSLWLPQLTNCLNTLMHIISRRIGLTR